MKTKALKLGTLVLAISAFSFTTTVQAQERKTPDFDKMFKRFDANSDNSITLEEYKSAKRKNEVSAEKLEKAYARMDENSDGSVTLEEMKAGFGKNKGKRKGQGKKK